MLLRRGLDGVRRLRAAAERRARAELARGAVAEREAAAALDEQRSLHESLPAPLEPLDGARLRALHLQGVRSAELLSAAAAAHSAAEEQLRLRRLGWQEAAAGLDAVDRLAERRRQESVARAQRAGADALDDLAALLHQMRRKP